MTDLSALTGGPAHASPRPSVARGRVVKAPAALGDPLTVTLENFSSLYEYEVPATNWLAGDTLPIQGALCLILFDDDGDTWVAIHSSPDSSSTAPFLDAKTAGAVGDGVADDTTALQNVFATAATTGRPVYIPAGTYKITAPLIVPSQLQVQGAGRWQSVISQATSNTPILKSTDAASHSVKLEDLALVYPTQQTAASHPDSFGIGWSSTVVIPGQSNVFYWTMRRLRITNATVGIGVLDSGDSRATMYVWNCHFEQILFQAIQGTMIQTGKRQTPVNTFQNITHVGAPTVPQTGAAMDLVGEWVINGLDIEDWTGTLIIADGGFGLPGSLHGLHVERHTITQASISAQIFLTNGKYIVKDIYYAAFTTATAFAHLLINTSAADLEYGNITVGDWGSAGTLTIASGAATDSHLCTGGIDAFQDSGVMRADAALLTHLEGGIVTFSPVAAGGVANKSLFLDAADGKLKFKDNGGTVNVLY